MTPARALFTLVTVFGVAVAAASCGNDEATGGNTGGTGGGIIGNGGSAGSAGSGRSGSGGTTGDDGGVMVGTRLGQACVNDNECDPDGMTPELTCMTSTTTNLDGGAPPKGLCTLECSQHDTCWAVDDNALCVGYGDTGYCLEGCFQGPPADPLIPAKCHNRAQFACTPLDFIETDATCTELADCPTGQACFNGACVVPITACLPACTGDQDCAQDMFCDRDDGTCKTESTAGDPLGTACNPDADPDPCSGFCQAISDVPQIDGMCAEVCSFLNPCAWQGDEAGGVCLFTTAINEDPAEGDYGFCSQFCDCSDDCRTPGFGCVPLDGLQAAFGHPGLCLYPFGSDGGMVDTVETCGSGSGGSGGSGNGNGNGGEGGAP